MSDACHATRAAIRLGTAASARLRAAEGARPARSRTRHPAQHDRRDERTGLAAFGQAVDAREREAPRRPAVSGLVPCTCGSGSLAESDQVCQDCRRPLDRTRPRPGAQGSTLEGSARGTAQASKGSRRCGTHDHAPAGRRGRRERATTGPQVKVRIVSPGYEFAGTPSVFVTLATTRERRTPHGPGTRRHCTAPVDRRCGRFWDAVHRRAPAASPLKRTGEPSLHDATPRRQRQPRSASA
jgi:hypothetical protein